MEEFDSDSAVSQISSSQGVPTIINSIRPMDIVIEENIRMRQILRDV